MTLPKRYRPADAEIEIQRHWERCGVSDFDRHGDAPVFAIDTPPPTVSGNLHLGHCYSYSHTDFIARYRRMRGDNVYYPMGFDDNGLPTERLVERQTGIRATDVGREAFVEQCHEVASQAVRDYEALWRRLALSVDWRYTYRTIERRARETSQRLFLDLLRRDLAYRAEAPTIWCPECRTAIAQAELADLERDTWFHALRFELADGRPLEIATTRPELLPACVAVFVHPEDARYSDVVGGEAVVPLFGQRVPVLADEAADPEKGTGAVMCCTFGDATDVAWWRRHGLPRVQVIGEDGRLEGAAAGRYAGLPIDQARSSIAAALRDEGALTGSDSASQTVRVHERCDTPVEHLVTEQWFVRVIDHKQELLAAGADVQWHPPHMQRRYQEWVAGLAWDWCISRQRYFGVPFPVWTCPDCGAVVTALESGLPVDPETDPPPGPCPCGNIALRPETDVMDTWATSSLTPQIAGRWLDDEDLYDMVFPFSLRPQAHEIIRTWAFYTIARSLAHFDARPWDHAMISGWGIAPEGSGKISKSRGDGGPMSPYLAFERYSADAVRYWAASTTPGKDAVVSEEKIQAGAKLATKLWNVARLADRFIDGDTPRSGRPGGLTPADRWILSRLQGVIDSATVAFDAFDYAAALHATEAFFWHDLADNYLEMAKRRLYDESDPGHLGACYSLRAALLATLKLLAPTMPHVTDVIFTEMFAAAEGVETIHRAAWPTTVPELRDPGAETTGDTLVGIAALVRRYKSESEMSLGAELTALRIVTSRPETARALEEAASDLMSVTRARSVSVRPAPSASDGRDLDLTFDAASVAARAPTSGEADESGFVTVGVVGGAREDGEGNDEGSGEGSGEGSDVGGIEVRLMP